MGSKSFLRLIEGSLVAVFVIQGLRMTFAALLAMLTTALVNDHLSGPVVYAHLALVAALVPAWFSPRRRSALPLTLMVSAVLVATGRVVMALPLPGSGVGLYAGLGIVAVGGVYLASLLRANVHTWITSIIVGLSLDQLFRAWDTFDFSLHYWFDTSIGDARYRIPWFVIQIGLTLFLVVISFIVRHRARQEPYEPANLSPLSGFAFGSFLMLEMSVLAIPGVIARWTGVSAAGVVPWLLLATALPLMPTLRIRVSAALNVFDRRVQGWVLLFLFILLVVIGNRVQGYSAASALIVSQFIAVLLLYWIPFIPEPDELEQVGPSISLAGLLLITLTYAYSLTFEYSLAFSWLESQGLLVVLAAVALLGIVKLAWRPDDPWIPLEPYPVGVAPLFIAPVVIFGLLLSSPPSIAPVEAPPASFRVATYNMNGGYNAQGAHQLDLVQRTIEASLADIVVLQEVDAGRPVSFGVDQAQYLARHLGMVQAYQPTIEGVRGVAVLSRWPVLEVRGILLSGEGEQLGALRVVLQQPGTGREVVVISTRLAPGDETMRLQQLAVLSDLFDTTDPAILGGDLAGAPGDVVYQQLVGGGFSDPDSLLGIERGFTTPAISPTVRHDYLLVRGLVPLDSRQVDSAASDHRLVVVELAWPGE